MAGRDRPCPSCGSPPTNVYEPYDYNGTAVYMSYCSPCKHSFSSAPERPPREPKPILSPRPRPIASYTLAEILADPVEWQIAAADITSTRWHHLRLLLIERAGGRCEIRRSGCTGRATEVDHGVPRFVGAPVVDLGTLRACCRTCNGDEWRAYIDLVNGPPRTVRDLTAAGLALLRWLDAHDVPRHYARRRIDPLPGRPVASAQSIDDVAIWRRFNPPTTPHPPQRRRRTPERRRADNAEPRCPFAAVADLVAQLDALAVPLDVGPGPARDALAAAGIAAGQPRVDDAQRWRRIRAQAAQ
ncbi:HNH endonuclease [Rhodococcus triatomae]